MKGCTAMKRIKSFSIIIVSVAFLCIALVSIYSAKRFDAKLPEMEIYANNNYEETLVVVADNNFPPFSFKNDRGEIVGNDIEIINSIANDMKVNISICFLPWSEAITALDDGKADIVLGLEYNDKYKEMFLLSKPIEINQYVAFGKERYLSVRELFSKRIAVLEHSSVVDEVIDPLSMPIVATFTDYEDAFAAIEAGELDYLIARYSVGNRVLATNNFNNIKARGTVLYNNAFCIGVQKENQELLNRINNSIANCYYNGTTTRIADKWLGNFINVTPFTQFILANITVIQVIIGLFVVLLFYFFYKRFIFHKKKSENDLATGILNKHSTEELIQRELKDKKQGILFLIDIDDFKKINDTLGHIAGDVCIFSVANILKIIFRKKDIIGRIGGDEFMVFISNISNKKIAMEKAIQIKNEVTAWNKKHATNLPVTLSIGVVTTDGSTNFKTLYKSADAELYKAKKLGKNRISLGECTSK